MSPLRLKDNPSEKAVLVRGSPSWYCFKFIKYILMLVCLMILLLIQQFSIINDNFTQAYKENSSSNEKNTLNEHLPLTSLSLVNEKLNMPKRKLTLGNLDTEHETIIRVKRNLGTSAHRHDDSHINLSDLLIMYPCCTTMAIILGMEMLGQALKDPLSKTTNLILILLCISLSVVVFTVSLMAAIRTIQTTMIILTVLSALFFLFELADFILLLLS